MNPWSKAEIVGDPGPPSDWSKAAKGGLTAGQLKALTVTLAKLRGYFDHDGQCRRKVDDCLEVVEDLQILWTRDRKELR